MNDELVAEVRNVRFTPVRLRNGYDVSDVDEFLDQLCERLQAGEEVRGFVAEARFAPVRFVQGYDMGEVDAFLDRMVADAQAADRPGDAGEVADARWANPVREVTSPLGRLWRRRRDQ